MGTAALAYHCAWGAPRLALRKLDHWAICVAGDTMVTTGCADAAANLPASPCDEIMLMHILHDCLHLKDEAKASVM